MLSKSLERAKGMLSSYDISVFCAYVDFRISVQAAAASTVEKDVHNLLMWRRRVPAPELSALSEDSVMASVATLRQDYKVNTFNSVWKSVKAFLKWYARRYVLSFDVSVLDAVKLTRSNPTVTTADILSKEDIMILSDCCTNTRDRAILWLLYDSYGRASETTVHLQWRDFVFDRRGIKMNLAGKTKRPRYIRLSKCNQYLLAWRADYWGLRAEGEAPVFLRRGYRGEPQAFNTTTLHDLFRRLSAEFYSRTGRRLNLHPHILRHTGITHDIADGLPLAYVSMKAWGVPNSPQILNYVHLSGGDADKILFEHLGFEVPAAESQATTPSQCPHCDMIISPGFTFCPECGERLTPETRSAEPAGEEDELSALLKNKKLLVKLLTTLAAE